MRIKTMEELAAYLRAEVVRIQASQATTVGAGEDDDRDAALLGAHLEGELAALQKTLVMVSDDAFADVQRDRARTDSPLRPATAAGSTDADEVVPVAVGPPWPQDDNSRTSSAAASPKPMN